MGVNGVYSTVVAAGQIADQELLVLAGIVAAIILFLILFVWLIPVKLWIAAKTTGTPVGIIDMIGMRLRRVPPSAIVNPMINAIQAGVPVTRQQLESHYLAGGNVYAVVNSIITAHNARINLATDQSRAIDLAGRNVEEAIRTSVTPRVIDCPDQTSGRQTIDGVAKDGVQLKIKARVTVRTNIDRLVGGATEQTIIARVGEGIVSSIGSADSYKDVLEHPDSISKTVLAKGLDAGTAFSILSIDIADVDVGENIGANLQINQANADKQIAQARAEGRRALAVAQEQEMKAREQEMRARVVEAEAQVPQAIADAFRKGQLGLMDYYSMKNVIADTEMRSSISKGYEEGGPGGTTEPGKPKK